VRLSLTQAQGEKRLGEFIAQEEARGIGPIDRPEFDGAVARVIKERRLEDRTSRSSSGGNSTGTRTRRDSGQDASR
jgi:hypothetical protein